MPEDQNSSKSIEIERVMKEARLRELIKGVYSSSYGESVSNKVCFETPKGSLDIHNFDDFQVNNEENLATDSLHKSVKSIETETVVLHREAERRKPLSYSEKRKRNETLAVGLSKTELLKTDCKKRDIDDEHSFEVKREAAPDSLDTKSTKEENVIEIIQTVSSTSFVTKDIKDEEKESTDSPISGDFKGDSNKIQDNNTTDSIKSGDIDRTDSGEETKHENKEQGEIKHSSEGISTEKAEKEENSHFKEVVSGVIKSLANNNSTENKEISEVTPHPTQSIIKEENDTPQVVIDQVKEDDVLNEECVDLLDQECKLENVFSDEEKLKQNNIKMNDQAKQDDRRQEHENIVNLENSNLEENDLQNSIKIKDKDKQEENSEENVILENILQNNIKVDCQIKEEEQINIMNPQTSSIEENINKEEEISNNDSNVQDATDANTVDILKNVESCQDVQKDEETTTEIKTDVPEAENVDITVKVNIQTISLGSVSEQEILEYNESEDVEKSECDEEVEEE